MYIFERSLWLVLDNDTERQKCKKGDHKSNRTKKRECSWQWKWKEEASFGGVREAELSEIADGLWLSEF